MNKIILITLVLFVNSTTLHAQNSKNFSRLYNAALQDERLRAYDQAALKFEALLQAYPQNNAYYQGLKRNLLRLDKYPELLAVVKKRLSVFSDVAGNSDLGLALYKMGRTEDARAQWQKTEALFPHNAAVYIQIANGFLSLGLPNEAIDTYKRGRKEINDASIFAVELASIFSNQGEKAKATEEYLNYYKKSPRQIRWIETQILSFLNSSDSLRVLDEINKFIRDQKTPDLPVLQLYANSLKNMNQMQEALRILNQIEIHAQKNGKNYRTGQYLYQFGQEAFRQKAYDPALQAYRMLLHDWPDSRFANDAAFKTAFIYSQQKKYNESLGMLEKFLERNPSHFEANYLKGMILLNELHEPAQATDVFEPLYKNGRTHDLKRKAALALGDAYLQKGEFSSSEKWYQRALQTTDPGQILSKNQVYYKLAEVHFVNKKYALAKQTFSQLKPGASSVNITNDLINDALEFSFLIDDNLADSTGVLAHYADYKKHRFQNKLSDAESELQEIATNFSSAALAPVALVELISLFIEQGKDAQAETALRLFPEKFQQSELVDEVYFMLAELLIKTERAAEAKEYLNKILIEYPYSTFLEETRARLRKISPAEL
ncbi:MAG: outer membrane protein assembly factor BamD [Calditrichaeota bacterium]|nr:MAG: outer membrane protein assembly factor BamD [Calditrichota bacterium]